jgi:hypothetical protein
VLHWQGQGCDGVVVVVVEQSAMLAVVVVVLLENGHGATIVDVVGIPRDVQPVS